jgi:arabinose-5-phosphate isomerase
MADRLTFQAHGREVLTLEAKAVAELVDRIDERFAQACELILECTRRKGRVVVVGIGKSGHVGGKITPDDTVLAISNSGETSEILTILPIIKRMGTTLIALTGNTDSTISRHATVMLDASVKKEACPLNLSPTASTTAVLAMGDALAVALLKAREFTREDFARSHPGGKLGRRLLLYVEDLMHTGNEIPIVNEDASLQDALLEMTHKGLGMTGVVDASNRLCGIYTDGDLRRTLNQGVDVYKTKIADVMNRNPKTITSGILAAETVEMMRRLRINGLYIVDDNKQVIGALNMHDLLRSGIV